MELPKKVKIGGHNYKIVFPYVFKERYDQWAQISHDDKEIRIGLLDGGGSERKMSSVMVSFIHELLHGIDAVTGHGIFSANEKAIDGFSECIYQVLIDNGWLKL